MAPRFLLRAFGAATWLLLMLTTPTAAQTHQPPIVSPDVAAWRALRAGEHGLAAAAFRDALVADPHNAGLHLGAAAAAFALRRDAEALGSAGRALALNPRLTQARDILGRALHRTGDIDGAIRAFEALVATGAAGAEDTSTLERWRREAALRDRMLVTIGNGVTVAFEGPEDAALAERAVASIERAAPRIWQTLSHVPLGQIAVVLYTTEQFRDITRSPLWAAGAFDGTIRVPMRGALDNPAELDRVLVHEYVHALVHELAPSGVPAWLNEGLAAALERNEPPAPAPAASSALPLRPLQRSFGHLPRPDAERAYAFSRFAVQRLLDDAGGSAIANLLRDLGAGVAFDVAFEHRMQRPFRDVEAGLVTP